MPKSVPLIVELDSSVGPESPCDQDGWKIYTFARNKFRTDVDPDAYVAGYDGRTGQVTPATKSLARKLSLGLAFWLSYFEHGEGCWSLQGEGSTDRWDSTYLAGVLIWERKACGLGPKDKKGRADDARTFLDLYTDWCNGHVYDWSVSEPGADEPIDSGDEWIGVDSVLDEIHHVVGNREVIVRGGLSSLVVSDERFVVVDEERLLDEILAEKRKA